MINNTVPQGGSIGKNTLVYTTSDVDLFVFINDLTSIQELKAQTRHILHTIRARLDSAAWHSSAGVIDCLECTTHSIKMRLTCRDVGQQHMVEIFPAYDILRCKYVEHVSCCMLSAVCDLTNDRLKWTYSPFTQASVSIFIKVFKLFRLL